MSNQHWKLTALRSALLGVALLGMNNAWSAQPLNLNKKPLSVLNAFSPSDLQQKSSSLDSNAMLHVRMQQAYYDVVVWGGDFVIHIPNGTPYKNINLTAPFHIDDAFMNGTIYKDIAKDIPNSPSPFILSAQQKTKAINEAIKIFRETTGNKNSAKEQTANLIVFIDEKNKANYAYVVSFLAKNISDEMVSKPTYIMNANSLEVYQTWDNIQTEKFTLDESNGGGFGGNERMGKLVYDSLSNDLPQLTIERDADSKKCFLENADVTVKDVRHMDNVINFACDKVDDTHNKIFWDADQDAVNGGYSPSNDALYAGKVIKEMYQKWYGIPVLVDSDGKPMMLNMRVHQRMDNAYWDGSQMTFGDGITMFYPLVSLGVAGHEISHGFTQQHSSLIYYGQSGGLNESFSDMAAQAAEFYSVGKNSWQIGPEIFKQSGQALRYMDQPSKDCHGRTPGDRCSIDNVSEYKAGIDVHYSSGIFNRLFYLMGSAKDSNAKLAFDVMVQANANYWTSNATFASAACGVMHAAVDHHFDLDTVKNAMTEVGIDASDCL